MANNSVFNNRFTYSIGKSMINKARQNTNAKLLEEREKGKFVNDDEKHRIYHRELRKAKMEFGLKSILATLGLTSAVVGGTKLLNSPSESDINKSNQVAAHERFVEELNVNEITGWEAIPIEEQKAHESDKRIETLSEEAIENANADFIIHSFLDSYNEEMETDLQFEDLKYFSTEDSKYLYKNEAGNYVFDYNKNSQIPSVASCDIACILDGRTMEIIYANGAVKDTYDSDVKYVDNLHVVYAERAQHVGYSSKYEEGKGFYSDRIYLDDDLRGNRSTEEAIHDAISNEIRQVIERKSQDKGEER